LSGELDKLFLLILQDLLTACSIINKGLSAQTFVRENGTKKPWLGVEKGNNC